MVVLFSKFLPGQRDTELLLDSQNYTYSRKKDRDTALNTAWRCSKNRSLKCNAMVYLDPNNSLSQGSKPHNHAPNNVIEEKTAFITSLKRKAADQRITATQNIVSEVLESASKDLNKKLPNIDSMSRVVQRSRAKSSGSIHTESRIAQSFILPPNCLSTANNDSFVLFDGEAPTLFNSFYQNLS